MLVDHLIVHDLNDSLPPFSFLRGPSHSSLPHHYLPDVLVDRVGKLANVYSDAKPKYGKQSSSLLVPLAIFTEEVSEK